MTAADVNNETVLSPGETPSLLRQIVEAADGLDELGKAEILRKIKLQKALAVAEKAGQLLKGNTRELTEDEIVAIVSEDRKSHYDEKNGN